MVKSPKEKSERKRCPKCGSRQVYVRTKTADLVCRDCAAITKLAA